MKSLKIGSLKLKNNLVLAPMFDVTDLPFRLLCRGGYSALSDNLRSAPRRPERPDPPPQKGQRNNSGCGLAYTEMIYVDALLHENEKTKQMTKTCKGDSPLGLQITGNDVKEFKEFVSRRKLWEKFELIDLNCGCPSMRIVGTRAGSYLLKDPEKIAAIVRILKLTKKPVTVKIRLGFRENNVLRLARIIEGAGADAIIVHARLAVDGNDVKADWKWIARVKKIVKIPVIGNGDVFSGDDAFRMMKETGCDGVMIGRGAIGNPLIFKRVLEYFKSKNYNTNRPARPLEGEFDFLENLVQFKEYLKLEKRYFGENVDFGKIKYVGGKFLRGFNGAACAREKFMKLKTWGEVEGFIEFLLDEEIFI